MEKRRMTGEYISGSAARQLETVPERERVEKEKRKKQLSQAAKHNRERAKEISPGYMLFLAVATVGLMCVCMTYLKLHADIAQTKSDINDITTSINTLTSQNNSLDYTINSYTDINYIIKVATEELGMIQASKGQVSYYSSTESEYMKQFADVPEE